MKLNRNRKIILLGSTAAIIALGAIAGPVLAQSVTGEGHDREHEQFEKDLAQKLGVPQSKVDDALNSMQGDRLSQRVDELQQAGMLTADQATAINAKLTGGDVEGAMTELRSSMMATQVAALVKQGTITQEQADQVTALVQAGVPVGLRVHPTRADGQTQTQPQHQESAAHQQEQVQELQQRGVITADQAKEITALITAQKTAEAEAAIHAAMDTSMLAQLVKDKTVTQAQADQITALVAAGVPLGIGGPGMGGDRGHHGSGMGDDRDHHGSGMDGDRADSGQQNSQTDNGSFTPQSFGSDASTT